MKNMNPSTGKEADYLAYEEDKPIDYKYYFFLLQKNFYVVFTFFVIAVTLASIYAFKIPDTYVAAAQLIVENADNPFEEKGPYGAGRQDMSMEYFKTQEQILIGRPILTEVADVLNLKKFFEVKTQEAAVDRVRSLVFAAQMPRSRIFIVSAKTGDPKLAASLANEIAKAYIRKSFKDSLYYSREILTWLEQAEESKTGKITVEDPFGKPREVSYQDLIDTLPAVQSSETLRSLREKESELTAEIESLSLQFRDKHPVMIKAKANLKFIQDSLGNEVKGIIKSLKVKARGKYKADPARILEEARVPAQPIPVSRQKIILMAGLVEIFLSFLIIFLIDHFDDTIHSMEDLQRRGILLPFLGPVPMLKGKARAREAAMLYAASSDAEKSELAESFRYLRVAINFSAPPEALKTLMLTSCVPHEGKSFVSQNIAMSLARDGNRTLLIDCDLRRPVLHRAFRLENDSGLTNYLTGNLDLDAVVKETFVENLFVIPSGPVSPNPAEILGSERMVKALELARQKYDRIIVDCPPLTGIGDGFVVGGLIGHTILVVAAGKTPADLIRHTQSHLDKAGVKILGMILNMMDVDKERHAGYTKYYYHTYTRYYNREGDSN